MDGSLEAFLYSENGGEGRIRTYGPVIETARIRKPASSAGIEGRAPYRTQNRLNFAIFFYKNLTLDFFLVGINCLPVADTNQMKSVVRPESGRISAADTARGFPRA